MKLCKHDDYTTIDWIKSPKWSTNEILISKDKVDSAKPILIVQFTDESPKKKYGWFVLEKKIVQKCRVQQNGRGSVYVVSMNKRKAFEPQKFCNHLNAELF